MTAASEPTKPSIGFGLSRIASLAAAGAVSFALMLDPYVLRGVSDARVHAGLPLMMLGVAGLFVYGLGFAPKTKALRFVFHPAVAWLLYLAGMLVVLRPA